MKDDLNRFDQNERRMISETQEPEEISSENKYEKRLVYLVIGLVLMFSTLAVFSWVLTYLAK